MNRLQAYLDAVPLHFMLVAAGAALALALFVPTRHRVTFSLILLPLSLTVSRLGDIGTLQVLAKTTSPALFWVVTVAALTDRRAKLALPSGIWILPLTGIMGAVLVSRSSDSSLAIVLETSWLSLTVAALCIARLITDWIALRQIVFAFALGVSLSLLIPATSIIIAPGEAFGTGLARFTPYGANPNQIGTLFILGPALLIYCALTSPSRNMMFWFALTASLALGMGVATASRSVILATLISLAPLVVMFARRPGVAAALLAIFAAVGAFVWIQIGDFVSLGRLQSLESARASIFLEYIRIIMDRPFLGIFQSSGLSYFVSQEIGSNPHNSFLRILYVGGITYAFPILAFQFVAIAASINLWVRRKRFYYDPMFPRLLVGMQFAFVFQGMLTASLYHPTFTWAFANILFSTFSVVLARSNVNHESRQSLT